MLSINKLFKPLAWLIIIAILPSYLSAETREKVSIQLKWKHGFQFAGYYAAKEKGFYAQEGLDVSLLERDIKKKYYIQAVSDGDAEYGTADTGLLLSYAKGAPVVWLSQTFQHSPLILITLKESGIISPYELIGKKVSYDIYSSGNAPLQIMLLEALRHQTHEIEYSPVSYDLNKLKNREFDAISAYLTNEPYWYQQQGVDINIINPQSYGIDFYGDNLFTSKKELRQHPARVEKMIRATLKGWHYALDHPDEIIELILKKYNSLNRSRDHYAYEAKITAKMIVRDFVSLGTIEPKRLDRILQVYTKLGLIDSPELPKELLYQTKTPQIKLNSEERQWLQENPIIKLALPTGYEPAVIISNQGELKGIIPDFIHAISDLIGQDITFSPYISGHESGYDVANKASNYGNVSVFKRASNEKKYLVTEPYMHSHFNIFTNKKNSNSFQKLSDLSGKKVAAIKFNTTAINYLQSIQDIDIIPAKSVQEQLEMLQYNKVDAIIGYDSYHYLINKFMFSDISLAFSTDSAIGISLGINPKHSILHGILNKAVNNLSEQNKQNILQKWIGDKIEPIALKEKVNKNILDSLTAAEKKLLSAMGSINMCIDPNWMPFEKIDNGKHLGITADYFKLLEKHLKTPITLVPSKTWPESLAHGRSRKCDIFSLVMATPKRREFLNFTKPYLKMPLVVVTDLEELFIDNIEKILDKKIGIVRGYAYGEILRNKYPNIDLVDVDNLEQGLKMVNESELYGFIGTLATIGYQIQKNHIGQLKIAGKFDETWNLGIGTRNDKPLLNSIFNKGIDSISEKELQGIFNKWVSVKFEGYVTVKC